MKSFIRLMAAVLLLTQVSCDKDQAEELAASIDNVTYDGNNLTFTLTCSGADALQYCVGLFDSPQGQYIDAEPIASQQITIPGIIPDEKYLIMARATRGDKVTEDAYIFESSWSAVPYTKKILVTKFTGTWCGYCPQMTAALQTLEEKYPGQFVVTALHGGDSFETPASRPLEEKFFITGYPTAVIDYAYTSTQQLMMLEDLLARTKEANKAVCGIGLDTKIENNTLKITAKGEFGAAGKYRICVLLTEDSVTSSETIGSLNGDGIYNDVVRTFLTDTEGDEIGAVAAGSEQEFTFEKELNSAWNQSEINVVAYILKENKAGKYTVNNLNSCRAGESAEILVEE